MTSPDRDRERLSRDRQASAVRGDVLASRIYQDSVAGGHSNSVSAREKAERACNLAAVFVAELQRRDPLTCQLAAHLQGLPAEDCEAPVALTAPSALEAFEGAADRLASEAVDVAMGREGGR